VTVTIERFLQNAAATIDGDDPDSNGQLEAEVILAHVMSVSRAYLVSNQEKPLEAETREAAQNLVARRCAGVPIAYLLGRKEFWSLELSVSEHVLIPRPDTETLVERALEKVRDGQSRIIDLGTGSGAIAIAIASEMPCCEIVATERSTAALKIAEQNIHAIGVNNISLIQSDWYQELGAEQFEIIVANPPYIDPEDPHLIGDVRYEPREALVAGDAGRCDLNTIIQNAPEHLRTGGWLLVEHGYDQGDWVRQQFTVNGFTEVLTIRDLAGNERVTEGRLLH